LAMRSLRAFSAANALRYSALIVVGVAIGLLTHIVFVDELQDGLSTDEAFSGIFELTG
jgi:hypothetical protein